MEQEEIPYGFIGGPHLRMIKDFVAPVSRVLCDIKLFQAARE
jgi:hypothetical protein